MPDPNLPQVLGDVNSMTNQIGQMRPPRRGALAPTNGPDGPGGWATWRAANEPPEPLSRCARPRPRACARLALIIGK